MYNIHRTTCNPIRDDTHMESKISRLRLEALWTYEVTCRETDRWEDWKNCVTGQTEGGSIRGEGSKSGQQEFGIITKDILFCRSIMADYDAVLKCWPAMEADYGGIGNLVLRRLFQEFPQSLSHFPKYDGMSQADLASNGDLTAQGIIVLKKLGEVLKTRGNHGEIIKNLSKSHANQHKVPIGHFKVIAGILGKVMEEKAGLDGPGQQALKRLMTAVIADIEANYKELGFKG